jgi:hypothetical protein
MYIDDILFVIGCYTVTSRCTWPFPYSVSRGRGELFRDGMLTTVFWKVFSSVIDIIHVPRFRGVSFAEGLRLTLLSGPAKDFVPYAVTRFRNV